MTEKTIILPDGRKLGYALYGPAGGRPVLYFHGTPSSRLEVKLLEAYLINVEQWLLEAGLQLIAVDRPGMGLSSYHPGGTILSFAADAYVLVQSLAVSRCEVMCWSGGGPFALAMAWQHPAVIRGVYILSGFTRPFDARMLWQMTNNKWYFLSARYTHRLLKFSMNKLRNSSIRRSVPQWATGLPDPDYQLIRNPAHLGVLAAVTFREACREGAKGPVYEAGLYFNPFGFNCSDIQQPVHFWWGTLDKVVVQNHAETLAQQVKNSVLHYKEGEGHLSVYVHCFKEVIQAIASSPGA